MWISKKDKASQDAVLNTIWSLTKDYANDIKALLQKVHDYGETIDELEQENSELTELVEKLYNDNAKLWARLESSHMVDFDSKAVN